MSGELGGCVHYVSNVNFVKMIICNIFISLFVV